ncbi:MAG: YaeQ family protein [Methylobacter sp.]|nr:YaeQ family protein [Methylobacter sp.]MDP2428328.1 YaeQ family protein [Methylobacter sp.]MDP3055679.1 YaeQ family protein [Methylobacter sp.]MDP3361385.1 YaeQ family protein [Methylobacter sp.]MDZ4220401.1 YaeQ family protein [Methylobacter sp.]
MALKSTIYKADCQISDMDRGYYQQHHLTMALHPSETEERLMVRLLAFIINADEQLQFTKGLSTDDEPELWQLSLTDDIKLWVDVGMPDEKRLRKASSRADRVMLYTYGGRNTVWWKQIHHKLERFKNLTVINLPKDATDQLMPMMKRTMHLQASIQDGQIWLSDEQNTATIVPEVWLNFDN